MPEPAAPVDPSATVLRRIHKGQFNPSHQPPFERGAFNPTAGDADGISVYLEGPNGSTPDQLAACGRKPGEYYVVRFTVDELVALGIDVLPTPALDPVNAGHCSLPALSVGCKQADPNKVKDLQVQLVVLAADRIVLSPTA